MVRSPRFPQKSPVLKCPRRNLRVGVELHHGLQQVVSVLASHKASAVAQYRPLKLELNNTYTWFIRLTKIAPITLKHRKSSWTLGVYESL